jgi:hypothetical protein
LPPWPGGLVQRVPCYRSGRGPGTIGNGAWSSAGPRAGEARPMRSTSGSSAGRSRSPSCTPE